MRRFYSTIAVGVLSFLAGCRQEPRVSTKTQGQFTESMQAVQAGMTGEEKAAFEKDCLAIVWKDALPAFVGPGLKMLFGGRVDNVNLDPDHFRKLDGMTAAEIKAEADRLRAAN